MSGCTLFLDTDTTFTPARDVTDDAPVDDVATDTAEGQDTTDCVESGCTCEPDELWCEGECLSPGLCCTDEDCQAGCDEITHLCRCIPTDATGCHNGDVYFFDSCDQPVHVSTSCSPDEPCVQSCATGHACPDAACPIN